MKKLMLGLGLFLMNSVVISATPIGLEAMELQRAGLCIQQSKNNTPDEQSAYAVKCSADPLFVKSHVALVCDATAKSDRLYEICAKFKANKNDADVFIDSLDKLWLKDIGTNWTKKALRLDGLGGRYKLTSFVATRQLGNINMQARLIPIFVPMSKFPATMADKLTKVNQDLGLSLNKGEGAFLPGIQIVFNAMRHVIGEYQIQLAFKDTLGNEVVFHKQKARGTKGQVIVDVVPTFSHMWRAIEGELEILVQLLDKEGQVIMSMGLPTEGQKAVTVEFLAYLRADARAILAVD